MLYIDCVKLGKRDRPHQVCIKYRVGFGMTDVKQESINQKINQSRESGVWGACHSH
jgi:hypothetical protein